MTANGDNLSTHSIKTETSPVADENVPQIGFVDKLRILLSGSFIRSVALVAGGTALAQIIMVAASPLITRLYGPNAFGVMSVFNSAVSLLTSISTMSYALAIAMPKRARAAYELVKLSFVVCVAVSGVVGLLLAVFHAELIQLFELHSIASYLWLIPIAGFCAGLIQIYDQWHIRKGNFRAISQAAIGQALFVSASRVAAGLTAPSAMMLVLLGTAANMLNAVLLYVPAKVGLYNASGKRSGMQRRRFRATIMVARRYGDFPLYRAPQIFLNTVSRSIPSLLFAAVFSPAIAGYYAVAQSVLYMPVSLIAMSIGKVFLQRLAGQAHTRQNIRPLVIRATVGLALLGALPFSCIILFGPWLFSLIFGAEWREAGIFARWLALWVFFHFVNIPTVQSLPFSNSQRFLLAWEVVTTIMKVVLVLSVGLSTRNPQATVAIYAIFGALAYAQLIWVGIVRAGTRHGNA